MAGRAHGFTEKQKIAFAQSQTVPVIHDGAKVVKDSWAIAGHLEAAYPDKPLFKDETALSYARFVAGWVDTVVHPACLPTSWATFTIGCGRSISRISTNRAASGWARSTSPPSRPRPVRRGSRPSARRSSPRAGS